MSLDGLLECAGEWKGTSTLQDPGMGLEPTTSESSLTIAPLLDGRFTRIDYTWRYRGKPQSGSMLIGFQRTPGVVTMHWIDSWHNGETIMACEGGADGRGITVRGTYPAPPGPDWGWRIAVAPDPPGSVSVLMHNISPDGEEEVAVTGRYSRA